MSCSLCAALATLAQSVNAPARACTHAWDVWTMGSEHLLVRLHALSAEAAAQAWAHFVVRELGIPTSTFDLFLRPEGGDVDSTVMLRVTVTQQITTERMSFAIPEIQ